MSLPESGLQIRSTVVNGDELQLSLESHPIPEPDENEVVVRVEATPLNPSDLPGLLAFSNSATGSSSGEGSQRVYSAQIPAPAQPLVAARVGVGVKAGNEGAGTVVKAGSGAMASALLGKTVAVMDGAMYCQYRKVNVMQCLPINDDTSAREAAACFVNPLTALGFVETMKLDGGKGIVHTAAASNLGQMLNRLCQNDGIPLVNIVRKEEQVELLKSQGAEYVCNSSSDSFQKDLTDAIAATGAYVAFDAIGGGDMANQILGCMERAALRNSDATGPYGTDEQKQLYVYGRLNPAVHLNLSLQFGFSWGIGAWLMPRFMDKIGMEAAQKLRQRVAEEIKTTFASNYTREISLAEALDADVVRDYSRMATGSKFLINPTL